MYLIEIPNQPLALEQIGKSRSERYLVLRFVLILRIDPIASNVLDWLHLMFKFPKGRTKMECGELLPNMY